MSSADIRSANPVDNPRPKNGAPPSEPHRVVRLFVALELPGTIRSQVSRLEVPIIGVKWNEDQQIHLTLQFIGEVKKEIHESIRTSLRTVVARPFKIGLNAVGCFPAKGAPKVLWAGISSGATELHALQESVDHALKKVGLKVDQRKYYPHVTLGRNRTASRKSIQAWLLENQKFRSSEFKVNKFGLYSSILVPQGAIHRLEEDYKLVASGN